MKVTLLVPPSLRPSIARTADGSRFQPPLGLMALAAVIADEHDISLMDGQLHKYTVESIVDAVADDRPDLLGISLPFSGLWRPGIEVARGVREAVGPDVTIVWGGNVSTFRHEDLLRDYDADIVVRFEADRTFPELLRRIEGAGDWRATPGISWRDGDGIRTNEFGGYIEDLDELPFPAYRFLEHEERYDRVLISTRGCPHGCIYCSTRQMWGRWRARSVENVLAETAWHVESADPDLITFTDDNFAATSRRALEICEGIKRAGWDFDWGFSARVELITRDLVSAGAATNVRRIFFGIESGSARVLDKLGRRYTPEDVYQTVEMCMQAGIAPICSFMIGIPYETRKDAEQTLDMLENLNTPLVQLHVFTPLIGTPVCRFPADYGVTIYDPDPDRDTIDSSVNHRTEHLSREEITELYLDGKGIVAERAAEGPAYREWLKSLRG